MQFEVSGYSEINVNSVRERWIWKVHCIHMPRNGTNTDHKRMAIRRINLMGRTLQITTSTRFDNFLCMFLGESNITTETTNIVMEHGSRNLSELEYE